MASHAIIYTVAHFVHKHRPWMTTHAYTDILKDMWCSVCIVSTYTVVVYSCKSATNGGCVLAFCACV